MIILVTGGSGCGKSTWAEKLVQSLPSGKRVYIATMQVYDRESEIRVQRHRAQRAGLGFRTVECEKDLASAPVEDGSVVLLEDLVNLTHQRPVFRRRELFPFRAGIPALPGGYSPGGSRDGGLCG